MARIEHEFGEISHEVIRGFAAKNDRYGTPTKYDFVYKNTPICCSPTSLRYVYHALLILRNYKASSSKSIVEVGCGYGGLFLAICYFSSILNIPIPQYHIVDFPQVCNLIDSSLQANHDVIHIQHSFHSCFNYGKDIDASNLFLISNYCFTEIEPIHRNAYIETLFKKVSHGFIIWQTLFNVGIENINIIGKSIHMIEEERPQTAPKYRPNFFVCF